MSETQKAQRTGKRSDLTEDERKVMFSISGTTGLDPRTARAYLKGEKTTAVAKYAIECALREIGRPELIRKDVAK